MNPAYSETRVTLSDDDRDGACSLYGADDGAGGAQGAGGACSDASCPGQSLPLGYPCEVNEECASSACEGQCVPVCATDDDCPADASCSESDSGLRICSTSRELFGGPCGSGDDCASEICLTRAKEAVCSAECADDRCPPDYECRTLDEQQVCVPKDEPAPESSCAAVPARRDSTSGGLVVLVLALAGLHARKRRQLSNVGVH
jgi:hypothetical protein